VKMSKEKKVWYCDKCDFETTSDEEAKEHSKQNPHNTLWIKGEA